MSISENEKAYMPSFWSKQYEPAELLERYFKFATETTSEVRRYIANELDISYGSSARTKYDVYGTNLPKDTPILLFIHGGYWTEFSKDLSAFVVPNFVAHGIKVVVGGYDLCPKVRLTDIVNQAKLLIEKVLAMAFALGSKCVWVVGHSAGAHLTASILHDQNWLDLMEKNCYLSLLKGLVLIAGIYDIEPLLRTSLKENLNLTPDEIKFYSFAPINESSTIDNSLIPLPGFKVIVTVGEYDSPIFIEESRRYARKLTKLVDNIELLLLRQDVDHFNIVENLTNKDFILSKKLVKHIIESNPKK